MSRIFTTAAAALVGFLFLSLLASIAALGRDVLSGSASLYSWMAAAVIAGVLVCALGRALRACSDLRFLLTVLCLSLTIKLAVVWLNPDFRQLGDFQVHHGFVAELVRGHLSGATLERLSASYDYRAWLSRSFPFYLPLRWLAGEHDLRVAQYLHCGLSTLLLWLTWVIGRRSVSPASLRWAMLLFAFFPYHLFVSLNYTADMPGAALFAAILVVLLNMKEGRTGWATGLALAVLLFCVRTQRGLDVLVVPILGVAFLFLLSERPPRKKVLGFMACASLALALYIPASIAFDRWMASHDIQQKNSGSLAFLVRGWNPVSLGEYFDPFRRLDTALPPAERTRNLSSVLFSQAIHQPMLTFFVLPAVKGAKYFLVGFANGVEQGLQQAGTPAWAMMLAEARIVFAPVFLVLTMFGVGFVWREKPVHSHIAFIMFIPLLACVAVVALGEASPRYSHAVHGVMALLAGCGVASLADPKRVDHLRECLKPFFRTCAYAAVAYGCAVAVIFGGLKVYAKELAFADMRRATVSPGKDLIESGGAGVLGGNRLSHLEQTLRSDTGQEVSGTIQLPRSSRMSLFVYSDASSDGWVRIRVNRELQAQFKCGELALGKYWEAGLQPAHESDVKVEAIGGLRPCTVHWGYLRVTP